MKTKNILTLFVILVLLFELGLIFFFGDNISYLSWFFLLLFVNGSLALIIRSYPVFSSHKPKQKDPYIFDRALKKIFVFLLICYILISIWSIFRAFTIKSYYEADGKGYYIQADETHPYLCLGFHDNYSPCTRDTFLHIVWFYPIFVLIIGIALFFNPKTGPFVFLGLFLVFGLIYAYEKEMVNRKNSHPDQKV